MATGLVVSDAGIPAARDAVDTGAAAGGFSHALDRDMHSHGRCQCGLPVFVGRHARLREDAVCRVLRVAIAVVVWLAPVLEVGSSAASLNQAQATTRDETAGKTWIERLERADRIPGLRIPEVIVALGLEPGDVVADIGAGTGAFSIPFGRAVAPNGKVLAQDIWPELMDHIGAKARAAGLTNLETVLGRGDDPSLPVGSVDVAFFHDVFHNAVDRPGYLARLVPALTPTGRVAIIEQEYDDPIAQRWDVPENRITPEQVDGWMRDLGFHLVDRFDLFEGANNPEGAGMPERWFVVYGRR